MKVKIDYVKMYEIFMNLADPQKDFDTLEGMQQLILPLEELAELDRTSRYALAIDDTTMVYVSQAIGQANQLLEEFTVAVDAFLGFTVDKRLEIQQVIAYFLVSYGIILYKRFGYEVIGTQYAMEGKVDISKLDLPAELLDEVANDLTHTIDTLRLILTAFKQFGAYFAEYQAGDLDDVNDIVNKLEDLGFGVESIATLNNEDVSRILGGDKPEIESGL